MTFAAIRFAIDLPDLNVSERITLIMLADRAGKTGHCFPSQVYLAERTGLAVRTVRDALNGLESKGVIKRSKRFNGAGRTADDYLILVPRVAAKSAASEPAKSAATPRQNVPTIPTCPYGLGNEEDTTARKLVLISGGVK